MELSTHSINGYDEDESFTLLCEAFDLKKGNANEMTEFSFWLNKLGLVRNKYVDTCVNLADDMDKLKSYHASQIAKLEKELAEKLKELEDKIAQKDNALMEKTMHIDATTQVNAVLKNCLMMIRNQIDSVIHQITDEQVVETVNLESENEEAENDNHEEMQEQGALVSADTEPLTQTGDAQNEHEQGREEAEQDSNVNQNTVNTSDAGKENVRPQSTPISASSDSASKSVQVQAIVTVPKSILPLLNAPKPVLTEQNDEQATAEHDAAEPIKSSDAIMVKVPQPKKKKDSFMRVCSQNIALPGKYVMKKRKHAFVDDDNEDDQDSDDNDDEENGGGEEVIVPSGYYIVRKNSMKLSQKRAKKGKRAKRVYLSQ